MPPDYHSKEYYDWFFEQLTGEPPAEESLETQTEVEPHLESDQVARLAEDSLEEPQE